MKIQSSRDSDNKSQARKYELEIKINLFNGTFIDSRCSVKSDKTKSLFLGVSKKLARIRSISNWSKLKKLVIVFLELTS